MLFDKHYYTTKFFQKSMHKICILRQVVLNILFSAKQNEIVFLGLLN